MYKKSVILSLKKYFINLKQNFNHIFTCIFSIAGQPVFEIWTVKAEKEWCWNCFKGSDHW